MKAVGKSSLVVFLALQSIGVVIAQPDLLGASGEKKEGKKDPVLIYREAGASEEQELKIRQIAHEFEQVAKVKVERLRNLSKQLREMSFQSAIDETKALSVQSEINELQATLNTERIKLMLKIRAVLSPEQNEKLVTLMREREKQDPNPRGL